MPLDQLLLRLLQQHRERLPSMIEYIGGTASTPRRSLASCRHP